jgi:hypothetical protein
VRIQIPGPFTGRQISVSKLEQLRQFCRSLVPIQTATVRVEHGPGGVAYHTQPARRTALEFPWQILVSQQDDGNWTVLIEGGAIYRAPDERMLPFSPADRRTQGECCVMFRNDRPDVYTPHGWTKIEDVNIAPGSYKAVVLVLEYTDEGLALWSAALRCVSATADESQTGALSPNLLGFALASVSSCDHFHVFLLGAIDDEGTVRQYVRSDIFWAHPPRGTLRLWDDHHGEEAPPMGWEIVELSEPALLKIKNSDPDLLVQGTGLHAHTLTTATTKVQADGAGVSVLTGATVDNATDNPKRIEVCLIRAL